MRSIGTLFELAVAIAATGLVSRLLFLVLDGWDGGFNKTFAIHVWSFCVSGFLFVIWCSAPHSTNWFAAHKVFLPEVAWFIRDCLRMTGQPAAGAEEAAAGEERHQL